MSYFVTVAVQALLRMQKPPKANLLVRPSIWATATQLLHIAIADLQEDWIIDLKTLEAMQISAICKIQKARPLYAIIIVIRRLWNPLNMLCLEVWGWSVVGMSQTAKSKRNQRESNLAVPWRQRWLSWLVQEWGIPTHVHPVYPNSTT